MKKITKFGLGLLGVFIPLTAADIYETIERNEVSGYYKEQSKLYRMKDKGEISNEECHERSLELVKKYYG